MIAIVLGSATGNVIICIISTTAEHHLEITDKQ